MKKYVLAADVAEAISKKYNIPLYDLVDVFADIPAADVVGVVKCKNCKYWQDNNNGYPHNECRWGKDETPDADDYCSGGERNGDAQ